MEKISIDDLGNVCLNNVTTMENLETLQFNDERNFNLLMVASEAGHIEAVKDLINRGFDVNKSASGETAISLALKNSHFDVILMLLKANSRYPSEFSVESASIELKEFVKVTEELHDGIRENAEEKVKKILAENANLRHFYNLNNDSALTVALSRESFDVYEILMTYNIFFGAHEKIDEIMENLSVENQRKLREIHIKFSRDLSDKTIFGLMTNSFVGHDVPDIHEKLNFVLEAFTFLSQIPLIQIILKLVAASKNFKIIFDFNRDSVKYLDPTSEPYTNGLFYLSGRILIGAKNLLDAEKKIEVFGVLAHEMCHFAMFLTYDNFAKPYRMGEADDEMRFSEVADECEEKANTEELIEIVFEEYPESSQHAELIVRVPHLLTIYHKESEKLEEARKNFSSLFEFYENFSHPEMERILPEIEARANKNEHEKKISTLKKTIFVLVGALILSVCAVFLVAAHESKYSWKTLTNEEKTVVKNSLVDYHGVNVTMENLFVDNLKVYESLKHHQISPLLKNFSFLDSRFVEQFEDSINFKWTNMTDGLRDKVLDSIVNFQGVKVKFEDFLNENSSALKILSSSELKNLIKEFPMNISSSSGHKLPVYMERRFIEIQNLTIDDEKLWCADEKFTTENSTKIKTSQEILNHAEKHKIFILVDQAGAGKSSAFKKLTLDAKEKFPTKWIQFVDLRKKIRELFLGKNSSIERNFFDKLNLLNLTSENVAKFLSQNFLNLSTFESLIFTELFTSNRVILIFDGLDETPKIFHDFFISLLTKIKEISSNQLWISSNIEIGVKLSQNLNSTVHKFQPFTNIDRNYFVIKFGLFFEEDKDLIKAFDGVEEEEGYRTSKVNETNLTADEIITKHVLNYVDLFQNTFNPDVREKFRKIFSIYLTKPDYFFKFEKVARRGLKLIKNLTECDKENPLNLFMGTQLSFKSENDFELYDNFDIFNAFVDLKFFKANAITAIIEALFKLHYEKKVSKSKIHQIYALKTFGDLTKDLEIMETDQSEWSFKEISSYGIVEVESEENFEFIHESFVDFFVLQFIIENIYENNFEIPDDDEMERRTKFHRQALEERKTLEDFNEKYLKKVKTVVEDF